jgi:hypothetical protein
MTILTLLLIAGIVATLLVVPLMNVTRPIAYDWDGTSEEARREDRRVELEESVLLYREALRSGTVCTYCTQANPAGSRFCMDCGRPLVNAPRTEPVAEHATR